MRRCAKRKSIPRSIPAGDAVTMKFFRGRSSIPACRASLCSEKTSALTRPARRSEEHTSELQSRSDLVCRLLLEKKKNNADRVICRAAATETRYVSSHVGKTNVGRKITPPLVWSQIAHVRTFTHSLSCGLSATAT